MSKNSKIKRDKISTDYLKHKKEKCELCGKSRGYFVGDYWVRGKSLTIHHLNLNPLDNRKENLQTLCRKCHDNVHTSLLT